MATYSKRNLSINNFMSPVTYVKGRGTSAKECKLTNFYDNKMNFLNKKFNCKIYTLPTPNFLPNIAIKFYGTSSLWWVIAKFNGIMFPLKEIQTGTKLFIPNLSEISKYLNQAQTKSSSEMTKRVIL